jgi:hypothetical protein
VWQCNLVNTITSVKICVTFKFQFGTINLEYLKPTLCHKFKRLLRHCKSGRYTNLSVQMTCFTGWSYPYQPSLSWTQEVHCRPLNTRNNYKLITASTLLWESHSKVTKTQKGDRLQYYILSCTAVLVICCNWPFLTVVKHVNKWIELLLLWNELNWIFIFIIIIIITVMGLVDYVYLV